MVVTVVAWAILPFLIGLALGRWVLPSEAAIERRREANDRELERPEHDHQRALQIAQNQSELSRLRGTGFDGGA